MNIAVTSTGGGVGQSIIKALKNSEYRIFSLDEFNLAAGLYMVEDHYLIPPVHSEDYIPFLVQFCLDHKIDLLFPGGDPELKKFSEFKNKFNKTKVVISDPFIVNIADDKFLTNDFLKNNGFPFVKTSNELDLSMIPFIMKPKQGGARSKNVFKILKKEDIPNVDLNQFVFQEYIEGPEYTCGTVTLEGKFRGCIIMRRILRDGDTYKAFVEHNEKIESLCKSICEILKPEGAFNIQLRLKDKIPYVFEFNARCSGTTASRALSGFNEPLMIANYLLKGDTPLFDIKDLTILRYWNEIAIKNEDLIKR